jgi:hypothetical protein
VLHDLFTLIDIYGRLASHTVNCGTSARDKADNFALGKIRNAVMLRPLPKSRELLKYLIQLREDAVV